MNEQANDDYSIMKKQGKIDQDTIVSCVGKYRKSARTSSFAASMNISNALKLNQFNSIHLSELHHQ